MSTRDLSNFTSYGSSSVFRTVGDLVDEVDARYDVHTVEVVADNGDFRVTIKSTDDDLADVAHEVFLDHFGGVTDREPEQHIGRWDSRLWVVPAR